MPTVRSFLAGAMAERAARGGAVDTTTPTSSEATPDGRPVVMEKESAVSPIRAKDKAIELSFGSDRSHPMVGELVAKSSPVVGR